VIISAPDLGSRLARRGQLSRLLLGVAAARAGAGLGALDLLLQHVLPYPWANLANSLAVWAVAAWAFAAAIAKRPIRGAGAGALLLVVAVEAYYAAAALFQHDGIGQLTAPTTALWCLFGVVAGVLFGAGGGAVGDPRRGVAVLGAALPAAVLVGEAAVIAHRVMADRLPVGNIAVAVSEALVGILVSLTVSRRRGDVGLTLLAAGLLAVSAFGAFAVLGVGFATG
jgi:hypothetical protein